MNVIQGDNLEVLRALEAKGEKFDLIELDGPYGANLEGWDNLTEGQYIEHYSKRLLACREILQPWGAVFVFGYPEGCAEIKAWCHRTGTLYLRRWLTWYKQLTAHKGRKVETILFFLRGNPEDKAALEAFGHMLKRERQRRGWTLAEVGRRAGRPWWHRGGNLYFETGSGGQPSAEDLRILSEIFQFDPDQWAHVIQGSYEGVTDLDYIGRTYPEETASLNDSGLRSKPIGLYLDLFTPVVPRLPHPKALILYGGSGNAGIAAEALGYDVTVVEQDPARSSKIQSRAAALLPKWRSRVAARSRPLPGIQATQLSFIGGE